MARAPLAAAGVMPIAALAIAALAGYGARSGEAQPPTPTAATLLQERGKYLVRAADCAACHTAGSGAFAGGVALHTPFGVIHGTNITPDKDHGIGNWSADEFYVALHDGKTPRHQLYPAMPYTSYRGLSRADSDAMYAYLMSIRPVRAANLDNDIGFPFNLRFGLQGWKMLFLDDKLPDASAGGSAAWRRGQYIANALGHCAECHTPRGRFGQLQSGQALAGNALGRIGAPAITPAALAARGWTPADLRAYLATGLAPQGSAFDEMHTVVRMSTQYLAKEDLAALSTYLMGDQPPPPAALPAATPAAQSLAAGRSTYLAVCAGCHGGAGEGRPNVAVAMLGNSTVRDADPRNLVVSTLDGIAEQRFPGTAAMQAMPGFAGKLNDKEVADLANYVRATWGGQAPNITPEAVKALR
jgi:mono/diheme cytochrome c family protein